MSPRISLRIPLQSVLSTAPLSAPEPPDQASGGDLPLLTPFAYQSLWGPGCFVVR